MLQSQNEYSVTHYLTSLITKYIFYSYLNNLLDDWFALFHLSRKYVEVQ